jgi:hypothetical protein
MADNFEYRGVMIGIDQQRNISFVYTALAMGLSRGDFEDSLDFYFGGDRDQYDFILELWDETVEERVQ